MDNFFPHEVNKRPPTFFMLIFFLCSITESAACQSNDICLVDNIEDASKCPDGSRCFNIYKDRDDFAGFIENISCGTIKYYLFTDIQHDFQISTQIVPRKINQFHGNLEIHGMEKQRMFFYEFTPNSVNNIKHTLLSNLNINGIYSNFSANNLTVHNCKFLTPKSCLLKGKMIIDIDSLSELKLIEVNELYIYMDNFSGHEQSSFYPCIVPEKEKDFVIEVLNIDYKTSVKLVGNVMHFCKTDDKSVNAAFALSNSADFKKGKINFYLNQPKSDLSIACLEFGLLYRLYMLNVYLENGATLRILDSKFPTKEPNHSPIVTAYAKESDVTCNLYINNYLTPLKIIAYENSNIDIYTPNYDYGRIFGPVQVNGGKISFKSTSSSTFEIEDILIIKESEISIQGQDLILSFDKANVNANVNFTGDGSVQFMNYPITNKKIYASNLKINSTIFPVSFEQSTIVADRIHNLPKIISVKYVGPRKLKNQIKSHFKTGFNMICSNKDFNFEDVEVIFPKVGNIGFTSSTRIFTTNYNNKCVGIRLLENTEIKNINNKICFYETKQTNCSNEIDPPDPIIQHDKPNVTPQPTQQIFPIKQSEHSSPSKVATKQIVIKAPPNLTLLPQPIQSQKLPSAAKLKYQPAPELNHPTQSPKPSPDQGESQEPNTKMKLSKSQKIQSITLGIIMFVCSILTLFYLLSIKLNANKMNKNDIENYIETPSWP